MKELRNATSVIASEAKQSSFCDATKKAGLLRRFASRNDGALPFRARNGLAVLFHKAGCGMIEQVEHGLRRPAQFCALRRHHNGPVDQDGMRQPEIEELVIAPFL